MIDQSGLQPEETSAEGAISGAADSGGRRGAARQPGDYRAQLRSRRWNAAPLRNPEVERTDPRIAVAALVIISAVTLLILVVGYASGFWQLPADEELSGAVAALELLA